MCDEKRDTSLKGVASDSNALIARILLPPHMHRRPVPILRLTCLAQPLDVWDQFRLSDQTVLS